MRMPTREDLDRAIAFSQRTATQRLQEQATLPVHVLTHSSYAMDGVLLLAEDASEETLSALLERWRPEVFSPANGLQTPMRRERRLVRMVILP